MAVGSWVYVRYYLPEQIAQNVINQSESYPMMPKPLKQKVVKGQKMVEGNMDVIEKELDQLNLSFDDLLIIVDEVDPDEVKKTIKLLTEKEIYDPEQVFEVGKANVHVEHVNPEIFRETFLKYADSARIKKALRIINENNMLVNISVPVARETVKRILIEKRESVSEEIKNINKDQ